MFIHVISDTEAGANPFFRAISCNLGMDPDHRYRYRNILNIEPDNALPLFSLIFALVLIGIFSGNHR